MVAVGEADIFQIVVLAACANAFLRSGRARVVAFLQPRKTSLNWFIPALVKSSVGSFCGTSDDECTSRCPFSTKKCRNFRRISEPVSMRSSILNDGSDESIESGENQWTQDAWIANQPTELTASAVDRSAVQ